MEGRIEPALIQNQVRSHYGAFRLCYEQGLARNAELKGLVTARFVIDRDGSVRDVSDAGSDLPDPEVKQCILDAFRDFHFPKPERGIVTVVYPIMLEPG